MINISVTKEFVAVFIKANAEKIENDFERFLEYSAQLRLSDDDNRFIADQLEGHGLYALAEVFEQRHYHHGIDIQAM